MTELKFTPPVAVVVPEPTHKPEIGDYYGDVAKDKIYQVCDIDHIIIWYVNIILTAKGPVRATSRKWNEVEVIEVFTESTEYLCSDSDAIPKAIEDLNTRLLSRHIKQGE